MPRNARKTRTQTNSFSLQLVGKVAPICQPRSIISKSGILLAFANIYDRSISPRTYVFLHCALLAGQYRYAQRVIGEDWPRKGTTAESVLRYYLLRGMVHVGCDDFQMAIRCFWTVLSVPSDAVSAYVVDAWKKMVLAKCLLLQDSVPYQALVSPPSGSSNSLTRFLTPSNAPESATSDTAVLGISAYLDLAKACHAGRRQAFEKIRSDNVTLWGTDNNLGLVERLATDMEHRCIVHLASVYSTLPMAKVAATLGKSEVEAYNILGQVEGLNFKHTDGLVALEVENACALTADDATSLVKLSETIRRLDVSVAKSSKYQSIKVESGRPPRGVDDF
mmetsp:Transcript_432/g.667  ORF Transcript_432/g.667 Transcript_432/m.667 type:complete len:335 (+) Transcript_432:506-1510(+)